MPLSAAGKDACRQIFRQALGLLLLTVPAAFGQIADDFFHNGAQSYITNDIPKAKAEVEAGLELYPDDTKLKKLDELLKQQQQQQQQQNNQKQDQQNQDRDKKDQQQQQAQDNKPQQDQQQQKNSADRTKDQKQQPAQPRSAQAGQMTPQQAQRLLDSQKGAEQVLWFKPEGKPEDKNKPVKDW